MRLFLFFLILFNVLTVRGQDSTFSQGIEHANQSFQLVNKLPIPKLYLELGLGFGFGNFRDFATSPLLYSGVPIGVNIALRLNKLSHETYFGVNYSFGNYSSVSGASQSSSIINTLGLYYNRLIPLKQLSNSKWKYKSGGQLNVTGNVRNNPSLQNNSLGIEMVNTLFLSGKVERNVSRTIEKDKKFLFINYHVNPKVRRLSFQLNLGVMNNNFRNGYAYIDQSAVVNEPAVFGGYSYNWFEGFRMSSSLDYFIKLNNDNAIQWSYIWDAYHTGGDINRFEMVSHTLRFSILFNTK